MGVCTIIKNDKMTRSFVATVEIPVGFEMIKDGEDAKYPYDDYISIDSSGLSVDVVEELYPSKITIEDPNAKNKTFDMTCESRVRCIKLVGPLFYNVVTSGFKPKHRADLDNPQAKAIVSPGTAFSTSGTTEINFRLGYACYECDYDPAWLTGAYDITLTQDPEFIVTNVGDLIHNREGEEHANFMNALNGRNTVTINYPFHITLTSKVAPTPEPDEDAGK